VHGWAGLQSIWSAHSKLMFETSRMTFRALGSRAGPIGSMVAVALPM
jgi:hypothetical protein